jgi:hypothetical protein
MVPKHPTENTAQTGINMSNIQIGGGIVGLVFSAGTVFIFLAGIPALRWFPLGAIALGALISVALHLFHDRKPTRPTSVTTFFNIF